MRSFGWGGAIAFTLVLIFRQATLGQLDDQWKPNLAMASYMVGVRSVLDIVAFAVVLGLARLVTSELGAHPRLAAGLGLVWFLWARARIARHAP